MKIFKQLHFSIIKCISITLISLAFVTVSHATEPATPSTPERIQEEVKTFLHNELLTMNDAMAEENIHIAMNTIDERINIPSCSTPFEFDFDRESLAQSYISVRVSCLSNNWYIYTNAKITRTRTIVVTNSIISPGTVLTSSNLDLADVDVKKLRHTPYSRIEDLVGARLKYRIREGQPVQSNMLCFVCKGDRITISAEAAGMQVKTSGIAGQDGVIGDTIEVINSSSQKTILAEVASVQEVVVKL
jgi:flagella basal body P-ring formation protein FlgA